MTEEWRTRGVVEELKVTLYLLSATHPVGRAKARVFLQLGFSPERWQEVADALRLHLREAALAETEQTDFGMKRVLEGPFRGPDGEAPLLRSIWFEEFEGGPLRLVTAYPVRGR